MKLHEIDPKKLRKHSQIQQKYEEPALPVVGDKNQTDYGYYVDGVTTPKFETKYLTVMPSCMTPTWRHDKKTLSFRVVGGVGHYEVFDAAGEATVKVLMSGTEICVEPGTTFRVLAGPTKLELLVCQDSKYNASLKEIAPAEKVATIKPEELRPLTSAERDMQVAQAAPRAPDVSRNERARNAMAAMRGGSQAQAANAQREQAAAASDNFFRNSGAGVNAKPITFFDDAGAG